MFRTPRPARLLTVLAALLISAGCSSAVQGSAGPSGGTPASNAAPTKTTQDGVAWMNDVCGALLPFIRTAATPPPLDQSSDPVTLVKGLSTYFGQASTSAASAITGMAAAGPSPIEGGDEVVTGLTGTLTTFKTTFEDAQTRIDALDTSDPQALATGLPAAIEPLGELANLPDPTAGLGENPELDKAAKQAANCKEIETVTGG